MATPGEKSTKHVAKQRLFYRMPTKPGDDLLSRRSMRTETIHRLRQSHPGFSDKCYDDTIHQGCFMAR